MIVRDNMIGIPRFANSTNEARSMLGNRPVSVGLAKIKGSTLGQYDGDEILIN